ncbi:MAG: cob(I)yrinic acid a,c-diamide adenosyltransferase [Proteobacteria bacterium]|nr:cob(I)yrinic acid a,c-diamide adenosyltransferase [Pseudomonadota bacterium]
MSASPENDTRHSEQKTDLGYIHLQFGDGVGKTTSAVGLAVRAAAAGLNVHFVQFMKPGDSSEVAALENMPGIQYYSPGKHPFIIKGRIEPVHLEHAKKALDRAWEAARGRTQVLVCDELLNTLLFGVLTPDDVLALIQACRGRVELILTGRVAPPEIFEAADYVNEIVKRKHPYDQGVPSRRGIEY